MRRGACRLLTASRPRSLRANAGPGTHDSPLKKNLSESRRNRDAEGRRTKNRSNRRQTIRKTGPQASLRTPLEARERVAGGATRSDVELCLEQLVHGLRVRLAAGCLHHLTDEPSDHCGFRIRLRSLVGIVGDDIVDELLDCGCICDLL